MPETQFDESLIGPLLPDRFGREPQSWGDRSSFSVADPDAARDVEREVLRQKTWARIVLNDQVRSLLMEVRDQVEPRSVLHGLLVWGPISSAALAGYLSLTITEVESCTNALGALGIAITAGTRDDLDDPEQNLVLDGFSLQRIFAD
jgi:hypothetical protein